MNTIEERLNDVIDNLQGGRSPLSGINQAATRAEAVEEVMLIMAAGRFNALRPGASIPDPGFLSDLRSRLLAETNSRL